jgi:hypothetical protein
MGMRFHGDELGDDLILTVSEQVSVIHETKVSLVGFAFGKVHSKEFRDEFFAGLARDKKYAVHEAFVAAGVERE